MKKPQLSTLQIVNMSVGFFGIQIGFALQNANVSRIFQNLGASMDEIPILWIAAPVTGLLVQPVIGYFSDRTWTRFGRRRPYFLVGAILTTIAMIMMPNAPYLWVAAMMLWVLDASLNITMEPFRAFVGDMLPKEQRARGFAMQGVFIGFGGALAGAMQLILENVFKVSSAIPADGGVADTVRLSFYVGAALLFLAVLYTIPMTKEYSPEELAAYDAAENPERMKQAEQEILPASYLNSRGLIFLVLGLIGLGLILYFDGRRDLYILSGGFIFVGVCYLLANVLAGRERKASFLPTIMSDLATMPTQMRQLAVVQFFSWSALFIMWTFLSLAVADYLFADGRVETLATPFGEMRATGDSWANLLHGSYFAYAAIYSFFIPGLTKAIGTRMTHGLNLVAGGIGLASIPFLTEAPLLSIFSTIGVGMAWASILTLPYAMLSNALPASKMGTYMGIFNFFIVIPQIVVASTMGLVMKNFLDNEPERALLMAGGVFLIAALSVMFVARPYLNRSPASA